MPDKPFTPRDEDNGMETIWRSHGDPVKAMALCALISPTSAAMPRHMPDPAVGQDHHGHPRTDQQAARSWAKAGRRFADLPPRRAGGSAVLFRSRPRISIRR